MEYVAFDDVDHEDDELPVSQSANQYVQTSPRLMDDVVLNNQSNSHPVEQSLIIDQALNQSDDQSIDQSIDVTKWLKKVPCVSNRFISRLSRRRWITSINRSLNSINHFINEFHSFNHSNQSTVLSIYLTLMIVILALLFYYSNFAAIVRSPTPDPFMQANQTDSQIEVEYDITPVDLTCHSVLWAGAVGCGLRGQDCQPFNQTINRPPTQINNQTINQSIKEGTIYRCPSRCAWPNLSQRIIGDRYYRADSYVCQAAIHSGVAADGGGAFRVRFSGPVTYFPSVSRHGLTSLSFDGWFPRTFEITNVTNSSHCESFDWTIFVVSILLLWGLIFIKPKPFVFLLCSSVWGYFWISLTSDDNHRPEDKFFLASERAWILVAGVWLMYIGGGNICLTDGIPYNHSINQSNNQLIDRSEDHFDEHHHSNKQYNQSTNQTFGLSHRLIPSESQESINQLAADQDTDDDPIKCPRFFTPQKPEYELHTVGPMNRSINQTIACYLIPFLFACHWSYLSMILPDINLDSNAFNHGIGGLFVVMIFSFIVCVFVWIQCRRLYVAQSIDRLTYQSTNLLKQTIKLYAYIILPIVLISLMWVRTYSFHLHHVFIGPLLVPLTRFRTRLSMISHAILLGISINGLAMWGIAPLWDKLPSSSSQYVYVPPPTPLSVSGWSFELVWPMRNDSNAIGSILIMNEVLFYQSSWDNSQIWINQSNYQSINQSNNQSIDQSIRTWNVDTGIYRPVVDDVYDRYDSHDQFQFNNEQKYSLKSTARSHQTINQSINQTNIFVHAVIDNLLPGLNYTAYVCLMYTYGNVGQCSESVKIQTYDW